MANKSRLVLYEEISISQLPFHSIFKIGFLSNIFVWGTLGAIYGVLAIFGRNTVSVGGEYAHGLSGFFTSLLIAVIVSCLGALVLAVGGFLAGKAARDVSFGKVLYKITSSQARKRQAEARKQVLNALEGDMQKKVPEGRLW